MIENVIFVHPDGTYTQIWWSPQDNARFTGEECSDFQPTGIHEPATLPVEGGTVADFADICAGENPDAIIVLDGDPQKIARLRKARKGLKIYIPAED